MYASPTGEREAKAIAKAMCWSNATLIIITSCLVYIELALTNSQEQILSETAIPKDVYIGLLIALIITSLLWGLAEWYLQRYDRYKTRHNIAYFYAVMLITTYVLLIIHLANDRGVFDFLTIIPIFFLPFIFIVFLWTFLDVEKIRNYIEKKWTIWNNKE